MDNGPENTVKQVVSNMKTKAISGQTDGAGFIGMIGYDYSWSTWMKNSIAIGEAGVSSDHEVSVRLIVLRQKGTQNRR